MGKNPLEHIVGSINKTYIISLFFCMAFVIPTKTHAGIFDTISKIITQVKGQEEVAVAEKNLQTVDLLKPTAILGTTSSDNTIAPEGTLSVSAGPLRLSTEGEVYIPEEDTINVYVVKKSDTLNSIAKLYGVSVNTIVWANNLDTRKVTEGQVLTILPVSGIRHTIKKGDTLKNIASKYSADVDDIALFNGVTAETSLSVGDILLIPDGEINEAPKSKEESNNTKKNTKKESNSKKSIKSIIKNLVQSSDGYYVRPIKGGVRTTGLHGHNAVDIASSTGTPIVAAASGKVILVKTGGYNGGYGNYVVISHNNGTQTLYAHNSENLVSVGDVVSQGEVVARVGSTGKSTGPHVHFEVRGARNPF